LTVPSVTQVLGVWSRFDYVQEWVLREAAERGTEVYHSKSGLKVMLKPCLLLNAG
jgi:hypothetical protein